ncbi:MAG: hypothetical protein ACI35O_09980 [Bacillaceae bacterium]
MKKIFIIGSALILMLQVGCNNNKNNDTNPNPNGNTTNTVSHWVHEQAEDVEDIKEDIIEAYEDDTFTEGEKRHIQRDLAKLHKKLTSKDAATYASKSELDQLTAAHNELEKIVNDTAATKSSVETAIKDVETKFKDVFVRAETDVEDLDVKANVWMDEFAYDAYDLVEEGKEYVAGTEDKMELKADIDEIKAEWDIEKLNVNVSDKEKAVHKEVMDIINNLEADIDKDASVVKGHIDKLEAKLKEGFAHINFADED